MFFNIQTNSPFREILTIIFTSIFVFIGSMLGQIPFSFVIWSKLAERDGFADQATINGFVANMDFASIGMSKNSGLILVLLSFVVGLLFLFIGVQRFHKRSWTSIIRPSKPIRWSHFGFGFALWIGLVAGIEAISYVVTPEEYIFNFEWQRWLILLLISLIFIPLQTSFEELFFRGYLMQEVGAVSKSRLLALIATSVGFGLMHLANPEIVEFGIGQMLPYYIGMGLFLGVLTLMDDGTEIALGVHAANNIFASLFITFESSALKTDAFFIVKEVNMDLMLPMFFVTVIIFLFIATRKYGWTDWSKLYGRVETSQSTESVAVTDILDGDLLNSDRK